MPPFAANNPRLRILSVGGNAVSAFLSWRLQATNSCDVTLVWKNGFETVSQYGISFKSSTFGNERFKPRAVVRSPEEAAQSSKVPFDYVLLCIKALPDVYDLASVIESVVTPQHTCILLNTTHALGIETLVEKRYPKNVVLSLVSAADIAQLGPSEFEHSGTSELWVGPANKNGDIPVAIQNDMSEALSMTLGTGQVLCHPSKNIQQQQFERLIGPIAFHSASVLFETPNHSDLLHLTGVRDLVASTVDELIQIAQACGCAFPPDFKTKVMEDMSAPKEVNSLMFQDYAAHRPMEIETYLGSPMTLAKRCGVSVPRLETLYAMLHHVNIANQKRKDAPPPPTPAPVQAPPPQSMGPPTRMSSNGAPRGMGPNGHYGGPPPPMRGRGSRAPSMTGPPPQFRRGPPPPNGMNGMNGYGSPVSPMGHAPMQTYDETGLNDDFAHIALYGADDDGYGPPAGPGGNIGLRERELMLRQKELALREREMAMRGPPAGRRPPPSQMGDFDEEDGEDYFDPMAYRGPPVNPDNIDMMSVTSRRARKQPSVSELRHNPEAGGPPSSSMRGGRRISGFPPSRPGMPRNRVSSRLMEESLTDPSNDILENPLMGYSSDRYGGFDRSNLGREGRESRTNSLTAARLSELQQGNGYGAYPPMGPPPMGPPPMGGRRTSHSPATPLSPGAISMGSRRPSPGQDYAPNGMPRMNRPSPPDVRQPTPRHPPGHGNAVAPQQVEQHAGVSNLYPPKQGPQVRSLTGSASASAGSGDSGRSAHENSAYSSQSSLGPRPPIGVR